MVVTGHWINSDWEMKYSIIEFKRVLSPHAAAAACQFIYEVINEWVIKQNLMCITTERERDMISTVQILNSKLCSDLQESDVELRMEFFHVICNSHIINSAIETS